MRTLTRHRILRIGLLVLAAGVAQSQFSPLAAQQPPDKTPGAPHLFHPREWYGGGNTGGANQGPILFSPTDNLDPGFASNFPGFVMHKTRVFLIFWTPNNTISSQYKDLLKRFVQDLNGTPFLNIVTQYYDNSILGPDYIQNVVTYGDSYTDTATAYPHLGTGADPLQDGDIQNEVDNAIAANGWPTGNGNFFAVFTEKGIESCNGGDCTPGTPSPKYCAYHNWFNLFDNRIYTNMPFVNTWPGNCNNTSGTPNVVAAGNTADADREISTFSHELFESITDPYPNATWTETNCPDSVRCGEIGDKCAYFFVGGQTNADGSNLTLHGNPYNVQPEWSNATFTGAADSGCTHAYHPADMDITKTGPGAVYAGGTFDYTIDVKSNGLPTAETPHFTDSLSASLQFQGINKPAGWDCTTPAVGSSGDIDCSRTNNALANDGSMNEGDTATFAVTSRVTPTTPNGSTISNTGTIAWDTMYAANLDAAANVHLSQTSSTSATVISSADVTISKTTLGAAFAGRDFVYVIDVENDGPSDAQNVSVVDTLPAGTAFVSTAGSGGFSCSGSGPVTCTKASMGAGAIAAITLTVHIPSSVLNGTTITNSVSVSSTTSDPNPGNNLASVSSPVNAEANLSITKTGPSAPMAGTDVTYNISATNLGPSDAQTVVLSDTTGAGTTFASFTAPAGWGCVTPAPGGTGTITCTKATGFAASATAAFALAVHLSSSASNGSELCDTASISSATFDPVSLNNSFTTCGTVRTSADLSLTQTATTSGHPGKGTATFTLTVLNGGPSDSQNISLVAKSDLFSGPPPAINVSTGGTCSVGVSALTCTWNSLALGASDFVTFAVPWKSAVGQICDSATISSGTPDPDATNNVSTVCIGKK